MIGYAFDEQSVQFEHPGFNRFDKYCADFEDDRCCEQTFNSRWYGPFVGVDFNYRPCGDCWNVYADIEYHWGNFKGRRNHGDGFDFYDRSLTRRSSDARGWVFAAGAEYDMGNCWTLGFSVKFQDWTASRNHRRCDNDLFDDYMFEGHGRGHEGSYCKNRHHTNARWHSYAINVTVGHDF